MSAFRITAGLASSAHVLTLAELNKDKPKAVPGGLWKEGSDTVMAWMQSSDNDEMGSWEEHPMVYCSQCAIENHLDVCHDCSGVDGSKGKFMRLCNQCEKPFRTSYNWKKTCSWRCRQERETIRRGR